MIVEYHDIIERSCRQPGIEFTLGTGLKNYIYALTNGHLGVIDEMIIYVRNVSDKGSLGQTHVSTGLERQGFLTHNLVLDVKSRLS